MQGWRVHVVCMRCRACRDTGYRCTGCREQVGTCCTQMFRFSWVQELQGCRVQVCRRCRANRCAGVQVKRAEGAGVQVCSIVAHQSACVQEVQKVQGMHV